MARTALQFALRVLRPGGNFVAKITRGGEGIYVPLTELVAAGDFLTLHTEDEFKKEVEAHFARVVTAKPAASRQGSAEIYIFASDYQPKGSAS